MSHMFDNCRDLVKLNISNFKFEKATNIDYIFYQCRKLNELDISNVNVDTIKENHNFLVSCSSIPNIICSDELKDKIYKKKEYIDDR